MTTAKPSQPNTHSEPTQPLGNKKYKHLLSVYYVKDTELAIIKQKKVLTVTFIR